MRQVYVVKTRVYICFYYLLAIYRHGASCRRVVLVFVEGFSFHRENATNLKGQIDSVERSESIARFRLVAFQEMNA